MDLKSQQEAYTILHFNRSEEQHGIRIQGHDAPQKPKEKRKNRFVQFVLLVLSNLRG